MTTTPSELIIGGDGRIGSKLREHLPQANWTTRRHPTELRMYHFDLLERGPLPPADIVYLCAGVNGGLTCVQDIQSSFRANIDGTVHIAEWYRERGSLSNPNSTAFVVWISSTTVEWQLDPYGREKRTTETILRTMPHVGIVRAGRVTKENIDELCCLLIRIGRERDRRLTLFAEDERPYSG